ncbi:MAG: hypothetical protein R3E90_04050 [Marinicella sp.]|nr:hypothetical protein [Xanthomonadales bacterium]
MKLLNLEQKSQFLYAALKEAQDNIRTYDTKAQIVGIGFIFTIGMVIKFNTWQSISTQWNQLAVITTWVLIIVPAVYFGSVLYPTRRVAPHVLKNKEIVKGLFYMNQAENVSEYVNNLASMDLEQELSYELLKVSYLRDLKRRRFLLALSVASFSLVFLFVLQLLPLMKWVK